MLISKKRPVRKPASTWKCYFRVGSEFHNSIAFCGTTNGNFYIISPCDETVAKGIGGDISFHAIDKVAACIENTDVNGVVAFVSKNTDFKKIGCWIGVYTRGESHTGSYHRLLVCCNAY